MFCKQFTITSISHITHHFELGKYSSIFEKLWPPVLAWKFEAEQMCRFSRAEFITGKIYLKFIRGKIYLTFITGKSKLSFSLVFYQIFLYKFQLSWFSRLPCAKNGLLSRFAGAENAENASKKEELHSCKKSSSTTHTFFLENFLADVYRSLPGSAARGCECGFGRSGQV